MYATKVYIHATSRLHSLSGRGNSSMMFGSQVIDGVPRPSVPLPGASAKSHWKKAAKKAAILNFLPKSKTRSTKLAQQVRVQAESNNGYVSRAAANSESKRQRKKKINDRMEQIALAAQSMDPSMVSRAQYFPPPEPASPLYSEFVETDAHGIPRRSNPGPRNSGAMRLPYHPSHPIPSHRSESRRSFTGHGRPPSIVVEGSRDRDSTFHPAEADATAAAMDPRSPQPPGYGTGRYV